MKRHIKVGFIVGTLGRGGAERQLIYMLQALKNYGVACRVLCLTRGEPFEKDIRSMNIKIEWVGRSKSRGLRLLSIINNLRKDPVDIIQSSHFYTNIYAGLAGKVLNTPNIGAIRNDLDSEIGSHKILGHWQVSLPDFLITNSKAAYEKSIMKGISPKEVEFVRNVVSPQPEIIRTCQPSKPSLNILFVGRLVKQKRPERFIRMAANLIKNSSGNRLKFLIAGDGILREELEDLAKKLKLSSEQLYFLGVCGNMREIYLQADILVSTSDHEGTPNAILEAMSYGIPVVATDVGGTSEILNDGRGVLVEPDNERQLVEATARLISNEKMRQKIGDNGRRYVEEIHSISFLQDQLINLYEKLL